MVSLNTVKQLFCVKIDQEIFILSDYDTNYKLQNNEKVFVLF